MADLRPVYNLDQWFEENKDNFKPPVCNKLMEAGQLKVMFVGAPNVRPDYHVEEGEELFFMNRGGMALPIMEKGKPKRVEIQEGEIFLLPGRIPHSPQRPQLGSIGLVIERERTPDETDGLRWYIGENNDDVLYEEWFYCHDLGTQIGPAIQRYYASEEHKTQTPKPKPDDYSIPLQLDMQTEVTPPFNLNEWLHRHNDQLIQEGRVKLPFTGETEVIAHSGTDKQPETTLEYDIWFWQVKGSAVVTSAFDQVTINEGCVYLHKAHLPYSVEREDGSIGLTVTMVPKRKQVV